MPKPARVSVHRFRHTAGLAILNSDGTVYLSADAAEQAGRALLAVAESIRREAFADSACGTVAVDAFANSADIGHD